MGDDALTKRPAEEALDEARAVRTGEELDVEAVDAWLKQRLPGLSGLPEVTQFPRGASNLTYLLRYPEHELVLRRPPRGTKAHSAHDMGRERRMLSALKPVYPVVPEVVAFCDDPAVLGCEFYLMERLRGIILRKDPPPGLTLTPVSTRRLCTTVLDQQIALHAIDVASHPELAALGKGAGYVRRQVAGWSRRFRKARTDNVTDFESVMAWLDAEQPADVASCVIHGDFRFDNVVLAAEEGSDDLRVVGVLDWEMATIGDPLMDLGSSLAYWVEAGDEPQWQIARQQPTHLPGMLTRDEVVTTYAEKSGRAVERFDFYLVFGLFRLAVIVQQIYYRYHHGQTRDPRFAHWHLLVNYLDQRCQRLIAG